MMGRSSRRLQLLPLLLVMVVACGGGCSRHAPERVVRGISFDSGGYRLVGDLYMPSRPNGVGIVFLHGSLSAGRALHLYEVLCAELMGRGYSILKFDMRGYGDSDNPTQLDCLESYDFVGDAERAAEWARQAFPRAAYWKWVMVGHSKGGGVAVHAGLRSESIDGVISISPGRRIVERFFSNSPRSDIRYLQRRKSRDMGLEELIPRELLPDILGSYDIQVWQGTTIEKPLLLIEGDREPASDLAFSRNWIESLNGPVWHNVLTGAGHYFGTDIVRIDGRGEWRTTRPEIVEYLVDLIDEWIRDQIPVSENAHE